LQKFDIENALSEYPSRAEILQFLDAYNSIQAAESAYKWLLDKSFHEQQIEEVAAGGAHTVLGARMAGNLWDILSNLAKIGTHAGFSIDTSIQNEELVFVVGNIPDDKYSSSFVEDLLALIFARLSNLASCITHTNNTTTARISMVRHRKNSIMTFVPE
jgi:hypothetical protein